MQAWLPLILILLALAMMVGPIMMMRPTKGQARRARLRAAAAKMGMRVRIQIGAPGKTGTTPCAIYSLPWPDEVVKAHSANLHWSLVHKDYTHEVHFMGHWDWEGEESAPDILHKDIRALIQQVPQGVASLSTNRTGLQCDWSEFSGEKGEDEAIAELFNWLSAGVTHLSATLNRYPSPGQDPDSVE